MPSSAPPTLPVSSAPIDVVPHIIIRSPRLQPGKIVLSGLKRLLQHYPLESRRRKDHKAGLLCAISGLMHRNRSAIRSPSRYINGELAYTGSVSDTVQPRLDMTREFSPNAKECPMKSHLLLTASGPLLILTSHESLRDPNLLEKLKHKGIGKFVAFEVPVSLASTRNHS
jgi:hypothetical protein